MKAAGPVEKISPLRAETVMEDMGFGDLDARPLDLDELTWNT